MRRRGRIFAGEYGRFCIEQVEQSFQVRDAFAVTDAEVRAGVRSPVVCTFNTMTTALRFCEAAPDTAANDEE